MSGAYVAKPAVVTPLDIPPEWNPAWPFPGPCPPGYTPAYAETLTADSTLAIGDATQSVVVTILDRGYPTTQPSGSIVWSATIDGELVQLRLASEDLYASSVSTGTSENAEGFWGSLPSFLFDAHFSDAGKIVVLSAVGTAPGGGELSQTADILLIAGDVWTATFSVNVVLSVSHPIVGESSASAGIFVTCPCGDYFSGSLGRSGWTEMWLPPVEDEVHEENWNSADEIPPEYVSDYSVVSVGSEITIEAALTGRDYTTYFSVDTYASAEVGLESECSAHCTVSFYKNGVLQQTFSKIFSGYTYLTDWISFNPITKVITELV